MRASYLQTRVELEEEELVVGGLVHPLDRAGALVADRLAELHSLNEKGHKKEWTNILRLALPLFTDREIYFRMPWLENIVFFAVSGRAWALQARSAERHPAGGRWHEFESRFRVRSIEIRIRRNSAGCFCVRVCDHGCATVFVCLIPYAHTTQAERRAEHSGPTCWIHIHVFLWRSHTNTNNVFRLCNPVYDMDTYTFKVNYSQNRL